MFKIIKTSTYNKLSREALVSSLHEARATLLDSILDMKIKRIKDLELQLHTQTAKKLPIKKSKNK